MQPQQGYTPVPGYNGPPPQGGPAPGYPGAQGAPQGYPQGAPQQGYPQGAPQGYPQGAPQGYPQGAPQGSPQGYPQGAPQGYPQGAPQGYPQGAPPGAPGAAAPGYPQGPPGQAAPQGYPPPGGQETGQTQGPASVADYQSVTIPGYAQNTPAEDVDDNENAQPSAPTAPGMDGIELAPGYENAGFGSGFSVPPPPVYAETVVMPEKPENRPPPNLAVITTDEAKEALAQWVSEHCCYGKCVIGDMDIKDMKSTAAYHYKMETFAEGRNAAMDYAPYRGEPIDGPQMGPAPGPWQVVLPNQASPFIDTVMSVEVPHTASVKQCHKCYGMGRDRCHRCYGRGRTRCTWCHGQGRRQTSEPDCDNEEGIGEERHWESCTWCHGSGNRRCLTCHGNGMVTCVQCQGMGQLKCYVKLTVNWINHVEDAVVEKTDLPDDLIPKATGQTAMSEEGVRVWPVNNFPDEAINVASHQLVQKHGQAFANEFIHQQRHTISIVPVTEIHYEYRGNQHVFFVYGLEKKVHHDDYPNTCGCCAIL